MKKQSPASELESAMRSSRRHTLELAESGHGSDNPSCKYANFEACPLFRRENDGLQKRNDGHQPTWAKRVSRSFGPTDPTKSRSWLNSWNSSILFVHLCDSDRNARKFYVLVLAKIRRLLHTGLIRRILMSLIGRHTARRRVTILCDRELDRLDGFFVTT